jgi:hypothetical protein
VTEKSNSLTLDMTEPELIMWDGATPGTAYLLTRGHGASNMSPRTKAITKALLLVALEEIEKANP